ncbi:HipA family kinase [Allokutzneria oryzae]|uniref:HipA family kinase n=1 Tax=Allokutzneria oryzae TaxID=1378989 RepID=A0ABV5ZY29_9PSEU
MKHVTAIRYVAPLREGGSLPGIMEADDLGTYVVKFHGAGQGRKVLVAEVVSAHLARALGLPVPDLVTVELDPVLAASEPDQDIQDLLRASGGLNLGMDYLPGALDFTPAAFSVDSGFAGRVVWFDGLIGNVDRSWRNPNMLSWHGKPHLIDHGSALTFHHNWARRETWVARPFDSSEHVLIDFAPDVAAADAALAPLVTRELLTAALARVPDAWLAEEPGFDDVDQLRAAYVDQLAARAAASSAWLPDPTIRKDRTPKKVGANRPSWLTTKGGGK